MKLGPKEIKELNQYLITGRNKQREFVTDDTPAMADGGRIGFKKGSRSDLLFENLTRIQNAERMGVRTKNAMGFINHPEHPNITYIDYRNKETGEIIRKYGVRVRRKNLKKRITDTTLERKI